MMHDFARKLCGRGYVPQYSSGIACPGCGNGNWVIGRRSAECAGCGTALPFGPVQRELAPAIRMPGWGDRA